MTAIDEGRRESAKQFLEALQGHFDATLRPKEVSQEMQRYEEEARRDPNRRNLQRETHFLTHFMVERIHSYLLQCLSSSEIAKARKALLAEGYRNFRDVASGTPMGLFRAPFTKQFNSVDEIVDLWWRPTPRAVARPAPDFALRAPCPYTIVGEVKYFHQGTISSAKRELVRGIYQCLFYRGLKFPHPERPWNYDYACLLAYDASLDRMLVQAWKTVSQEVKTACWEGANIFVMVLPSA